MFKALVADEGDSWVMPIFHPCRDRVHPL